MLFQENFFFENAEENCIWIATISSLEFPDIDDFVPTYLQAAWTMQDFLLE